VLVAGAGGLGSEIGEGLCRKGVGRLTFCDEDTVEPSNLNRQRFYKRDLWRNKALRLAKNLSKEGFLGTEVAGVALNFVEALSSRLVPSHDVVVAAVDDDIAREDIALYALDKNMPAVFTAVSEDGDNGYVFIQQPKHACFGCCFPREKLIRDDLENYRAPCPKTPAIKDILKLVSAIVLYALDTLVMERPIFWNYRHFYLAGVVPDDGKMVERLETCYLCGGALKPSEAALTPRDANPLPV